jgi:hypothetical protein
MGKTMAWAVVGISIALVAGCKKKQTDVAAEAAARLVASQHIRANPVTAVSESMWHEGTDYVVPVLTSETPPARWLVGFSMSAEDAVLVNGALSENAAIRPWPEPIYPCRDAEGCTMKEMQQLKAMNRR